MNYFTNTLPLGLILLWIGCLALDMHANYFGSAVTLSGIVFIVAHFITRD